MLAEAKVTLYRIHECGYYKHGADVAQFGDLGSLLQNLLGWVGDKQLQETATFSIEDDSDLEPTYCFDLKKKSTGSYLLITWNQIPSDEGAVASVRPDAQVGHINVEPAQVPGNNIPGYPAYFFFIPDSNVVANIRFLTAKNGHRNMTQFFKEYMAKWAPFAVHQDGDGDSGADVIVTGYAPPDGEQSAGRIYPRFETAIVRRATDLEFIRSNAENITKVLRKNKLSTLAPIDQNLLHNMLHLLGLTDPAPDAFDEVKVKYEVDFTPSEGEVERIIDEWGQGHNARWDDVGFKLSGDSKIYWLNSTVARDTFTFDVARANGMFTTDSLLTALEAAKNEILALSR